MLITDQDSLEQKLLTFFKEMARAKETSNYASDRNAFLFHMTDWRSGLTALARLYANPKEFDNEQANQIFGDLFYHILPHLNAAAEIYDDAPEIYKTLNKEKPVA